jgi:hypothetical protein
MKKRNLLIGIALLIFAAIACNSLVPNTVESIPTQTSPVARFRSGRSPYLRPRRKSRTGFRSSRHCGCAKRRVFCATRVAGAISIPLQNFEGSGVQNLSLEKDQWIITYCT